MLRVRRTAHPPSLNTNRNMQHALTRRMECVVLYGNVCVIFNVIYRVSINSFPDYKHLLQENYVEYKRIFFVIT